MRRRIRAFTLIEMLTVIAIIMVVMALAMPNIVTMMRGQQPLIGEQHLAQCGISRVAGRGFDALAAARIDRHAATVVLDAEVGRRLATMLAPCGGIGVQAVIDMKCAELRRRVKLRHRGQKHGRVQPAAVGNGDTAGLSRRGSRRERAFDLFENRFQTGVPMNALRRVLATRSAVGD